MRRLFWIALASGFASGASAQPEAAPVSPPAASEPVAPAPSPPASPPASQPAGLERDLSSFPLGLRATAELGFLAVLAHEIQLGRDGTRIDYPGDVGQSNWYFVPRLSVELDINRQHLITFLYQPLDLESREVLGRDLRIDGADFAQGTSIRARYGFPFYRLSWAFDVLEGQGEELAFGLSLQIRNATIEFESTDGTLLRQRGDVGPVPLLRARGRFHVWQGLFFAFEVDGIYAPISVLNGSDNEVEGALLDASVRFGWRVMPHVDAFLNVRYLGGGAKGQGTPTPSSDGWQSNWLHFLVVSLGATLDSRP
ncbi:MAG: hypothetical protein IT378_18090 [Sandaracinaceae bacterium]|nr:hypothetical protein [Sandaracinaceae bacterium]